MRTIELRSGEPVPAIGQTTWGYGEDPASRAEEVATLHEGLELGMTLVDTAELYADGAAEELVGEAIAGRRDAVFLVSKVLPDHATVEGTVTACRRSLRRLRTDRIDLYLLHWRGPVALSETLEAFAQLGAAGAIRYWGVGNFDLPDLAELVGLPGGRGLTVDQGALQPGAPRDRLRRPAVVPLGGRRDDGLRPVRGRLGARAPSNPHGRRAPWRDDGPGRARMGPCATSSWPSSR